MFKSFMRLFYRTPIRTLIEDELYDAERRLLEATTQYEHCRAIVAFRQQQVARLRGMIETGK